MKTKHAIGITINGNEVRVAFLTLVKGKAVIKALESTKLATPLEHSHSKITSVPAAANALESAFVIPEPELPEEEEREEYSEISSENQNVSRIYSLLDKFQNLKCNLAINSPILTVKYDFLTKEALPKEKTFRKRFRRKIDIWKDDQEEIRSTNYVEINDKQVLQIDYEKKPPIIDLMDEVNQFRAGNLNLVLMDTNELALVDLVNEIYKLQKDETTAVVLIEEDFSRVIFLKGRKICYITPIIHKGSMSPDVLEVIYSRIIFAQDQQFIPELNKILVAGHSSKLKAKYYFREKFPSAITGYLNSRKIQSDLRFKDRGLLFSRYAVPIALAWKALQKTVYSSRRNNLLPEYILERQGMPHLAAHGYLLFLLLGVTAFSFTWLLVSKNVELRKVTREISQASAQIENNKSLTNEVQAYDDQIIDIDKKIALVDSFSTGYDETIEFFRILNAKIRKTGGIWITQLTKSGSNVHISGIAAQREKIPLLANAIGGANLKKVTRAEFQGTRVYTFQLDKNLDKIDKPGHSRAIAALQNNIAD